MKTSIPSQRLVMPLIACLVFAGFVAGCNKYTESGETVGQKLDNAIDKTNAKVFAAGEKVEKKLDQAGAAVAGATQSIATTTGAALDKAGNTVFTKVDQVGAVVEDSTITASIKTDFLKDPGLSAFTIDVITVKGEVTLKGEVATEARRLRAEGITRHIVGVTKVNNLLRVSGS